MKFITLHITNYQNEELKKLIERKLYPNRAEAIRHAINDLIEYHKEK